MNAKCKMQNGKWTWFLAAFLIFNFTFYIPTAQAQGGLLPTPGETCPNDECRKQICPQSPVARTCVSGKCVTVDPKGSVATETLPCNYTLDDFALVGINLYNVIFGITGSLMLLFFAYGGYQYLTSMGNPEGLQAAKKTLTAALIGVILILGATLFVRFIAALVGVNIGVPAGGGLPKIEVR